MDDLAQFLDLSVAKLENGESQVFQCVFVAVTAVGKVFRALFRDDANNLLDVVRRKESLDRFRDVRCQRQRDVGCLQIAEQHVELDIGVAVARPMVAVGAGEADVQRVLVGADLGNVGVVQLERDADHL